MTANIFRLLEPVSAAASSLKDSITVGDRNWRLTDWMRWDGAQSAPDFVCVSYSWGPARTAHPLDHQRSMSDRVLPAIDAAQNAFDPEALWIDAFCVPFDEPARGACLRRLGAIYARASPVCVVLSSDCKPLLNQISSRQTIDEASLLAFARDDWVTRAWTYQEVVNSSRLSFVTLDGQAAPVDGSDLLTEVAKATDTYSKARGHTFFDMYALQPRLSGLEDLLVDWKISESQERGAYQVMSNLARRFSERPEDRFSAMLGAVSEDLPEGLDPSALHPAECFMRICEAKGDFSFIYSTAPRDDTPGKCWRPIPGELPPVLPYLTVEGHQEGRLLEHCLELGNMAETSVGSISEEARRSVESWLERAKRLSRSRALSEVVLSSLREVGFTGCGRCVELSEGYFFPQQELPPTEQIEIVVSAGVHWTFGAVGLAISRTEGEIKHFVDVGVFVGQVPKSSRPVRLGAWS